MESKRWSRIERKAWKPTADSLKQIEALASRGTSLLKIVKSLGIGERKLYAHKRESQQIRQALEKGKAIGIVNMTNKLWDTAQAGNLTAMIFWLKARAGWRDAPDPAAVNVNEMRAETIEEEKARVARRRALLKLLTVEERKPYVKLLEAAAKRQAAAKQPATEVTARPVPETLIANPAKI